MVALTNNSPLVSLFLAVLPLGSFFIFWWSLWYPRLPLFLLASTLLAGQVLRLPLPGQGGGLLASDLAVVLILATAVLTIRQRWSSNPHQQFLRTWTSLLVIFLFWSMITLIVGMSHLQLTVSEALIAASYFVRLATHLLLVPALILLFSISRLHAFATKLFLATVSALVFLGFLQLFMLPDFSSLTAAGWDPHQWRLTSTWLDPNFFAAYLLIAIPLTACTCQNRRLAAALLILGGIALLATQSRSGFFAAILSASILAPFLVLTLQPAAINRRRIPLMATLLLGTIIVTFSLLWPRLYTLFTDDPTATLRWQALSVINERLVPPYGLVGSGYNTYQFAAADAGLNTNFSQHSRAGSDNSFLTIWITTGLPGLLLFIGLWLLLATKLLSSWIQYQHYPALAVLFSLLALTLHSQIVNSFLYSHLLITLAWAAALALYRPRTPALC